MVAEKPGGAEKDGARGDPGEDSGAAGGEGPDQAGDPADGEGHRDQLERRHRGGADGQDGEKRPEQDRDEAGGGSQTMGAGRGRSRAREAGIRRSTGRHSR